MFSEYDVDEKPPSRPVAAHPSPSDPMPWEICLSVGSGACAMAAAPW